MQERHLRPWELDQLTIPEMALYIEKTDGPPSGAPAVQSYEEIVEYTRWWQSLTPRQRLEQAR